MPTWLLLLQIRPLLEKWLAIWPHILTEWLTANCDHRQWWETDRGKRLWKILSWGMAELDNIKPEEEVTRWGQHDYIHIFERPSWDISFYKCFWASAMCQELCQKLRMQRGKTRTDLWFSQVSWPVEEMWLLLEKAELWFRESKQKGSGTIQGSPSGQRAPALQRSGHAEVAEQNGLGKGWQPPRKSPGGCQANANIPRLQDNWGQYH